MHMTCFFWFPITLCVLWYVYRRPEQVRTGSKFNQVLGVSAIAYLTDVRWS